VGANTDSEACQWRNGEVRKKEKKKNLSFEE
jgi:hypothetical protein